MGIPAGRRELYLSRGKKVPCHKENREFGDITGRI